MPLKKLIIDDLTRFSTDVTAVASEESIRFLMDMYKQENKLVNPSLISFDQLPDLFKRIHHNKCPAHTQLIVEHETRSLITARVSANNGYSVHYSAMDVFCDAAGNMVVFSADHYFGKEYRFSPVHQQLKLPIFFVIAGGSPYQNDSSHCPIFSLQHLLLTAHDTSLHTRLLTLAQSITTHSNYTLAWFNSAMPMSPNTIYVEIKKNILKYQLINPSDSSKPYSGKIALSQLNPEFNFEVKLEELISCLPKLLTETARQGFTPKSARLPWFDLEPKYNVYPQSISQLTKYIDHATEKHLTDAKFDVIVGKNIVFFDDTADIQDIYVKECKAKIVFSNPTPIELTSVTKSKVTLFVKANNTLQVIYCGNDDSRQTVNVEDAGINALINSYPQRGFIENKDHLRQIITYLRSLHLSMKPHNNGIEHLTLDYAQQAIMSLRSEQYSDAALIDICYKDRYPFMVDLLLSATKISQQINDVNQSSSHQASTVQPLVDFIFSNQFILNCFSVHSFSSTVDKNKQALVDFLSYRSLIHLVTLGIIDLKELFHELTYINSNCDDRVIHSTTLKSMMNNKSVLDVLVEQCLNPNCIRINTSIISELLCSKVAGELFKIKPITRLYFSGDIDHTVLLSIKPEQLSFLEPLKEVSIDKMSSDEMIQCINMYLASGSPVSVATISRSTTPITAEFMFGLFTPKRKPTPSYSHASSTENKL